MTKTEIVQAFLDEKAVLDTKNDILYIPDVSFEPYWYHGFQLIIVPHTEEEKNKILKEYRCFWAWALETLPAPGTCAPDRMKFEPIFSGEGNKDIIDDLVWYVDELSKRYNLKYFILDKK